MCRLCKNGPETVKHTIAECKECCNQMAATVFLFKSKFLTVLNIVFDYSSSMNITSGQTKQLMCALLSCFSQL